MPWITTSYDVWVEGDGEYAELPIYINLDFVRAIKRTDRGNARVVFHNSQLVLNETYEAFIKRVNLITNQPPTTAANPPTTSAARAATKKSAPRKDTL